MARAACGADVVIAVNIQTPLLKREDITSAIGVLGQLVNLLGKVTVDKQLATLTARDVLVSPDLGDVSAASFERAPQAIEIGEAAARAMSDSLARYSVSETQFAQWRAKQAAPGVGLGAVDTIEFDGVRRTNAQVLEQTVLLRGRAARSTRTASRATCAGCTGAATSTRSTTASSRAAASARCCSPSASATGLWTA